MNHMNVGQYYLLPTKNVYRWTPIGFQVSASPYMYLGGTLSVSGFLIHLQLFGVSVLGEPSPMLEGISFGRAPIGFAVKSLFQKTMSSRRLLLTYSNSVGYSYTEGEL